MINFKVNSPLIICLGISLFGMIGCSNKTYEDCILEYVKPGMGEDAVFHVRKACNTKFKEHSDDPFRWWWEEKYEKGIQAEAPAPAAPYVEAPTAITPSDDSSAKTKNFDDAPWNKPPQK